MEWELNLENASDKKLEADGTKVTDAYPPKLERQENAEITDWPPMLTRLLNPALLLGDILKEIASDLTKKGEKMEAELNATETAETTEATKTEADTATDSTKSDSGTFSSEEQAQVRQDAQIRKDAMLEKYDRLQSRTQDQINKTQARLDQLIEQQENRVYRSVSYDAPKYTGV